MNTINIKALSEQVAKLAGKVGLIPVDKIPKDYSNKEQDTGVKWIDGREIYQKVFTDLTLQVGSAWAVVGDITGDYVINVICNTTGTSSNYYLGRINEGKLEVYSGRATQTSVDTVIVWYLKSAPTREPDAEPEVKKVSKKKTTK